jgi:hypothetical protein
MVQKKSRAPEVRRGRPRQYDPDRALAKAAAAFWKNGYAATSLDDLAAATDMNRGEIAVSADPSALAQVATATLHTLAVRSRVGVSRKQLKALAAAAIDLICGTTGRQLGSAGKRAGTGQSAE